MLLHKTPDEVRDMSIEDADLILYLLHCQQHKEQEDANIRQGMSKVT